MRLLMIPDVIRKDLIGPSVDLKSNINKHFCFLIGDSVKCPMNALFYFILQCLHTHTHTAAH